MKNTDTKKRPVVFFDFDNTITTFDVLDDMLPRFSKDDGWIRLEERWKKGEIGSKECLKGQIEGMRLTKDKLDEYLLTVKIDPYFKIILDYLNSKRIKTMVLTDDFDYILARVMKNNGISNLPVFSNTLKITGDRPKTGFPLSDEKCGDCAHCKQTTLLKNVDKNSTSIYVGDGLSDLCVSKSAGMVFAKGYLKERLLKENLHHVPFDTLKDVYDHIKKIGVTDE